MNEFDIKTIDDLLGDAQSILMEVLEIALVNEMDDADLLVPLNTALLQLQEIHVNSLC